MVKTSLPLPEIPSKIFNATSKHETPVIREQCEIVQKWLVLYGESGIRVRPSCNLLIIDTSEGAILYHTMPYHIVNMSEGSIPHHTMHTTPGPYHTIVDTSEGRQLPGHPALGLPILMINSSTWPVAKRGMVQVQAWENVQKLNFLPSQSRKLEDDGRIFLQNFWISNFLGISRKITENSFPL